MDQFKIVHTLLTQHYITEQRMLSDAQQKLLAYNQLLKSAVVLLIFISEFDDFAIDLKHELKKAIYERADKHIFHSLYTRIEEALISCKEKRFGRS